MPVTKNAVSKMKNDFWQYRLSHYVPIR